MSCHPVGAGRYHPTGVRSESTCFFLSMLFNKKNVNCVDADEPLTFYLDPSSILRSIPNLLDAPLTVFSLESLPSSPLLTRSLTQLTYGDFSPPRDTTF